MPDLSASPKFQRSLWWEEETQEGRRGWRRADAWWLRAKVTLCLSAVLACFLLIGGAAGTHRDVRQYVGTAVDKVVGGRSSPRANGTIVILVDPGSNMYRDLLFTLQNIEHRFNKRLGYPIQLLTDGNFPSESIMNRTDYITGGKAKWSLITPDQGWGPPDAITEDDLAESWKKIGFSLGYRNMCRFFSKFHWNHPALQPFEWIWRLDDGINFHCDLQEDPFMTMIENKKTYGYSILEWEQDFVIPTLWNSTLDFLAQNEDKHYVPEDSGIDFISSDGGKTYNHRIYYNNFEIVHRSFLESEAYTSYVDHLDRAGGFYKERWGDAPIRTIGVSLFLPKTATYDFSPVTGYSHDYPSFTCPDKPYCDCNPARSNNNGAGNY
ncbi:hypothetical protein JCM5296_002929 [Sporobolomyces johnsonii]